MWDIVWLCNGAYAGEVGGRVFGLLTCEVDLGDVIASRSYRRSVNGLAAHVIWVSCGLYAASQWVRLSGGRRPSDG